jgi:hypothetical protein
MLVQENKVKRGDNPPNKRVTVLGLCLYNQLRKAFQRKHDITEACFTLLVMLSEGYYKNNNGLTIYALSKIINPVKNGTNEVTNTQLRIGTLLRHGLIEHFGYGRWNAKTYIPTQRVLRELQEMCDKINEG